MAIRSRMMVPSTASRIAVSVQRYTQSCMTGSIYSEYLNRRICFTDVVDFVNKMDLMLDEISFPLATTEYRSFEAVKKEQERMASQGAKGKAEENMANDNDGKRSSDVFVVHVQFRQNATWQGTVKWAEKNEEKRFRSTLELLKIMDSALGEPQE